MILIDAGPDFRAQVLKNKIKRIDSILLTHCHFDHVAGLDDIRPFNKLCGRISVWGSAETINVLKKRLDYYENPVQTGGGIPQVEWKIINGPFEISELKIIPLPAKHGIEPVLGYRIKDFAYLTDVSFVPDSTKELMKDLSCLVLGAIRFKEHPTHFNLEQALSFINEIKPQKTFLTHITDAFDHRKVNRILPSNIKLGYDGLKILV